MTTDISGLEVNYAPNLLVNDLVQDTSAVYARERAADQTRARCGRD
jgi:hypothetical protein